MKLTSIVFSTAAFAATIVSALPAHPLLQSSDAQLNISSPIQNGVYIAGKTLPLTYIPDTSANLNLNIYLRGMDASSNETVIAENADVSNSPENAVHDPNSQSIYYQHSINYNIPTTTPAGDYEVIYQNMNTNVNTTIPISIMAYVAPSSALPSSAVPSGAVPSCEVPTGVVPSGVVSSGIVSSTTDIYLSQASTATMEPSATADITLSEPSAVPTAMY